MESVLIAGLAAAFALSALDYWTDTPIVRAIVGVATSAVSLAILGTTDLRIVPESLASTFLGLLAMALASRTELRSTLHRL